MVRSVEISQLADSRITDTRFLDWIEFDVNESSFVCQKQKTPTPVGRTTGRGPDRATQSLTCSGDGRWLEGQRPTEGSRETLLKREAVIGREFPERCPCLGLHAMFHQRITRRSEAEPR